MLPPLNEPQTQAVLHHEGPLLVFAGAGSGKTRVITYRIANLVARHHVPPYRVLAVTFTNKAASEMRNRLSAMLGDKLASELWVGTFHAISAKLLRLHGSVVGLAKNFVIYDGADQKSLVTRVLRDLDLDDRRFPPKQMLSRIQKEKQEGRRAHEMAQGSYVDEIAQRVYKAYDERLRAANAVDFEDLLLFMTELLSTRSSDAERLAQRFDHVLVDEFQDTNRTQYRLVKALVAPHGNLCVVGDDDQSIYRWRGADIRNIRGFRRDFPDATVVKLVQNYRSSGHIVAAALSVITPARDREPKELFTQNPEGSPIAKVALTDERAEAAFVATAIREAETSGTRRSEIAVFYRIHAQSRVLEEVLRAHQIPYQVVGGMRFFERAEIKDALAYLRLLTNLHSDIDLLRIVNVPARGIGKTTLDRLTEHARDKQISVHTALTQVDAVSELGGAAKKKLSQFTSLLASLSGAKESLPPSELLKEVLSKTGYLEALRKEDTPEADSRLENLEEFEGALADYEAEALAEGASPSLEHYLERITLDSDVDDKENHERVSLMTVHSAKGLEFDWVILTGMEEEMFPYRGIDPSEREELEEERRLAYVAITRAKARLFLTHVEMRQIFGRTRWGVPSRFLSDIPDSLSVQHRTTPARERFVDRAPAPTRRVERRSEPEGRYIDTSFFSDTDDAPPLRRGARVVHSRFGEGEVRKVETSTEPAVTAFFPGWGEKKILARFLKIA